MKNDAILIGIACIALATALSWLKNAIPAAAGAIVTGGTKDGAMNVDGTVQSLQNTLGLTPDGATLTDLLALGDMGS